MGKVDGIPELRINVLGGFELLIGGCPVESKALRRQKVKNLAAVLALYVGRELNCDHLADLFWPKSPRKKQRHNFYNLWALLHGALTLENGDEPYLVRNQNTCKLSRFGVSSDISEVSDLCDRLQFDAMDADEALNAYRELQELYRGDLLPGEVENGVIVRERLLYRERVIDALFVRAMQSHRQAQDQCALWFAQAALRLDPSREDICQLVMHINLDAGCTSSAVKAYNDLRAYLTEEFGLDPSARTQALFDGVICDDYLRLEIPLTGIDEEESRMMNRRLD